MLCRVEGMAVTEQAEPWTPKYPASGEAPASREPGMAQTLLYLVLRNDWDIVNVTYDWGSFIFWAS